MPRRRTLISGVRRINGRAVVDRFWLPVTGRTIKGPTLRASRGVQRTGTYASKPAGAVRGRRRRR